MTSNYTSSKRLNRDEFAVALRKGQGRALLHVIQYGLNNIDDLVLEACIHNQVYDQQLESGRGDWLFSMFRDTPYYSTFRAEILNALKGETESWDLFQLIQLARNMAASGDAGARAVMEEAVYRIAVNPASDDWIGVEDWLDLEGAEGMLQLARLYGLRLLDNPEDFVNDRLLDYEGHPDFREILIQNASTDNDIKRYWDYLEQRELELAAVQPLDKASRLKNTHDRIREEYTLHSTLEDAHKKRGTYPGHYVTFGKHAADEELAEIYRSLINEPDEAVCIRLLWVFRRAILPNLDQKLFQWAYSANYDLRSATINALAQISDPQVHDLAREKTKTGKLTGGDQDVLDLFLNNYTGDDALLINQSLAGIQPGLDEAHSLSYSILELANHYSDPKLLPSILWAYDNTPCAYCRLKTITWLDGQNQFTDAIRLECQYDADEDVRSFAIKAGEIGNGTK